MKPVAVEAPILVMRLLAGVVIVILLLNVAVELMVVVLVMTAVVLLTVVAKWLTVTNSSSVMQYRRLIQLVHVAVLLLATLVLVAE